MYGVLVTATDTDTRFPIVIAGVVVYDVLVTLRNTDTIVSIAIAGIVVYDVRSRRSFVTPVQENDTGINIEVADVLAHVIMVTRQYYPLLIVIADVAGHYVGITL